MNRAAVKFTDLPTFLTVMAGLGYNGEIKRLFYEQGSPPEGSAYFVPIDLLPNSVSIDQQLLDVFGGSLALVEEIQYTEQQQFTGDYMIFPLSNRGYLEVKESPSVITFAPETESNRWTAGEMIYVLTLEDGGGKEYYLATSGKFTPLSLPDQEEPQPFKTMKQLTKRMDQLSTRYPQTCRLYAMEQREFEIRRKELQSETE